MPIEISCTSCSKRLRVPDTAAGKRVKCPKCQSVLTVPAAGSSPAVAGGGYHLKTEDGQTFGPVPKKELDEWLAEGRVTAECQLLRDGADQWQWASDVYPQLEESAAAEQTPASAGSASGGFPNIDAGSAGPAADNPFAFAADDTSPTSRISGGRRKATGSTSVRSGSVASSRTSGQISSKKKIVAGLLCLFLGSYGVGRFYLGYTNIGLLQLFTCGGCGIWSIIDAIQVFTGKLPDARGRRLQD